MRNVGVSEALYAALVDAAGREGITVEMLAAEILQTVVGENDPSPREPAQSLQAQILTTLLVSKHEMSVWDLAQATGREGDNRGYKQVEHATKMLHKRGLLEQRMPGSGGKLYKLRATAPEEADVAGAGHLP